MDNRNSNILGDDTFLSPILVTSHILSAARFYKEIYEDPCGTSTMTEGSAPPLPSPKAALLTISDVRVGFLTQEWLNPPK